MSPLRSSCLALALVSLGCAGGGSAARGNPLPPPAPDRAGTREPGAGPAPGSRAEPRPAAARRPPQVHARALPRAEAVRRALDTANGVVGEREVVVGGVAYGDGCAAVVRAALDAAGAPLPATALDAPAILAFARAGGTFRRTRPAPGDLVFLAERPGGPAEHVGLVQRVGPGGAVLLVHQTERGVARVHLDAGQPWKARGEGGKILNDVLLVGGGRITAARLLVGYATVL